MILWANITEMSNFLLKSTDLVIKVWIKGTAGWYTFTLPTCTTVQISTSTHVLSRATSNFLSSPFLTSLREGNC